MTCFPSKHTESCQLAHETWNIVQAEIWVKGKQEVGEVMGDLGLAFIKLAKFETEKTMVPSQRVFAADTKRTATAAVKASRFYRESNALSVKHLVHTSTLFVFFNRSLKNTLLKLGDAAIVLMSDT
jgi:hypothetical protein